MTTSATQSSLPMRGSMRCTRPVTSLPVHRFLFPSIMVQLCHLARKKIFHPSFIFAELHKLFPLIKFPGESADNRSVHRAEKNTTFKICIWKLYIILVASKHLRKFTLHSSIYSSWNRKDSQVTFLSFFKCIYFLTLLSQCFLNN